VTPVIDIIDDDEAVRDSTRALLETYGFDVREHPSAEAFLDHSGQEPACLLVDHHLPGMTGVELLEHLRAKGDHTPALVVTARHDPAIVPRVARIGAKLLHKPIEPEELVHWIEHVRHARR
jgi:two-component system, LuxR family, response regulator FixJ